MSIPPPATGSLSQEEDMQGTRRRKPKQYPIADAAYYKALEHELFEGHELEDWLAAEAKTRHSHRE